MTNLDKYLVLCGKCKYIGTTRKKKDLGVTLSSYLKMSEHCGIAALKSNRILELIRINIVHEEVIS